MEALEKKINDLNKRVELIKIFNEPDGNFPNGIPNPLLKENQPQTGSKVKENLADFGVAFDGDFDRCFFFDEKFLYLEYIICMLARYF